jgi:phage replication O-like protein O
MASPQLEDGFTQIANEILDELAIIRLSPNQWQVLLFIIRKTYGFKKKSDYISNFQIVGGTGLCKAVVSRALRALETRNIITRTGKNIGFQKDWEAWQKLAELSTKVSRTVNKSSTEKLAVQSTELAELSTKVSSCAVAQNKKETIQKKDTPLNDNQQELFDILLRCPAIKKSEAYKLPGLLEDYPGINYKLEFKKFVEWWPGPKKRKKPWVTLRNWLGNCLKNNRQEVDSPDKVAYETRL